MLRFWAAILVLGVALGVGCGSARAQTGIYGMFSGGFVGSSVAPHATQPSYSQFGGTFGLYSTLLPLGPLRLGMDGRYIIESSGGSTPYGNQLQSGLFGPRLAFFSHLIPFSPYVQLEIGGASTNYGHFPSRSTSFAYQAQFGVDDTLFPHIDARVEYGTGTIGSDIGGNRERMQQISGGLVFRFF